MATYLIHELHGTHVAYTQNEIDTCLENGWEIRPEPVIKPEPVKKLEVSYKAESPKKVRHKYK